MMNEKLTGNFKKRVVAATTGLFSHGRRPLERTLDHRGDPGVLGPDSVSWRVIGDATAFVGGIRALLIQTAHPEVVAGVEQHSAYRDDPLGRLTRTSLYVTETTYGAMPEVHEAVEGVRRAHSHVRGRSDRGKAYSAGQPALAAWVHNVLTESFLSAYQSYGPRPLDKAEADRWIRAHPDIGRSPSLEGAVDFLRDPPLRKVVKIGYQTLFVAAAATIPERISEIVGVRPRTGGEAIGKAAVTSLRWALGSSPSWHLALVRAGAPVPPGLFTQPLRIDEGAAPSRAVRSGATAGLGRPA
jgi:hypothetical protein